MNSRRLSKWLISGPPLAYLLVLFAIPTLIMVVASFRYPGRVRRARAARLRGRERRGTSTSPLENYTRFFSDWLYTELFLKSLAYAALTTLLCLVIAYPLAMLLARSPKGQRELLVLLVILPFWSNFLIRVYAWMIILGPQLGVRRRASTLPWGCSRSAR